MTLSDLAFTLCDVKRDHIVQRTKGNLNSVYFYLHGEDTTTLLHVYSWQGPHRIFNLLYSKRALYLYFGHIMIEATLSDLMNETLT